MIIANIYKVLELPEFCSDEDLAKKNYRRLAKMYHPDVRPGDAAAEEKFKEINESMEIFRDPDKKAAHDEKLLLENSKVGKRSYFEAKDIVPGFYYTGLNQEQIRSRYSIRRTKDDYGNVRWFVSGGQLEREYEATSIKQCEDSGRMEIYIDEIKKTLKTSPLVSVYPFVDKETRNERIEALKEKMEREGNQIELDTGAYFTKSGTRYEIYQIDDNQFGLHTQAGDGATSNEVLKAAFMTSESEMMLKTESGKELFTSYVATFHPQPTLVKEAELGEYETQYGNISLKFNEKTGEYMAKAGKEKYFGNRAEIKFNELRLYKGDEFVMRSHKITGLTVSARGLFGGKQHKTPTGPEHNRSI